MNQGRLKFQTAFSIGFFRDGDWIASGVAASADAGVPTDKCLRFGMAKKQSGQAV